MRVLLIYMGSTLYAVIGWDQKPILIACREDVLKNTERWIRTGFSVYFPGQVPALGAERRIYPENPQFLDYLQTYIKSFARGEIDFLDS